MNQFRTAVRPHLTNALMSRHYADMESMFEMTREMEDQKNDLKSRYSCQNNREKKNNREQSSQ